MAALANTTSTGRRSRRLALYVAGAALVAGAGIAALTLLRSERHAEGRAASGLDPGRDEPALSEA